MLVKEFEAACAEYLFIAYFSNIIVSVALLSIFPNKDPNHLNLLEFFLNQIHLSILVRDKILIGPDRKLVTAMAANLQKGPSVTPINV